MKRDKTYFIVSNNFFRQYEKTEQLLNDCNLLPLRKTVDSIQCNWKQCRNCQNEKGTETFTSKTTGKNFKIDNKLNSDYVM